MIKNEISNFRLDWFSFTYKNDNVDDLLFDFWNVFPELRYLKGDMFIVGGRNFSHGLCLDDDITIRYDDWNNGKGINVEIPSHGLSHFFSLFRCPAVTHRTNGVIEVFKILYQRGCKPSRIDLAFDDYSKRYYPDYYYKKFLDKSMVTKMRVCSMNHSGDGIGQTFYLGDRRKRMIRIYDKDAESQGQVNAIRYEVELHANSAIRMFEHFVHSDEFVTFGDILLDIFDIRNVSNTDSNISRWDQDDEWHKFVKSSFSQSTVVVEKVSPEAKVESVEKHVAHNYSSFAFMVGLHGWDVVIKAIKEVGFKPQHIALIKKHAEYNGIDAEEFLKNCLNNLFKKGG